MKIEIREAVGSSAWDDIATRSAQAWLFHTFGWIDLEASLTGARDLSFALMSGGSIVAIMPLFFSEVGLGPFTERLLHNALHRQTGLAFAADLSAEVKRQATQSAMAEVLRIAESLDADRIHLAEQNLCAQNVSDQRTEVPSFVMEYGFQPGLAYGPAGFQPFPGGATAVVDQIVDLQASEGALMASLKQGCRRNVRMAIKSGVEVRDVTSADDLLDRYRAIAKKSADRTGEALPAREHIAALFAAFAPDQLSVLLATHKGQDAGAIVLLHYESRMYFFSGVSDPAFLKVFVNDLLHWEAIRFGIKRGFSHYRLGPVFPTVPRGWPIETVTRFKGKFGAAPYAILQGSLFRHPEKYKPLALLQIEQWADGRNQAAFSA